mgnify:CR=1 FL=1
MLKLITNKYSDSYDKRYDSANRLLEVLRQRCLEADINLSNSITFHSNFTRKELYVRGCSFIQIFIEVFYKYLCHNAHRNILSVTEFKIPRFGVECVKFIILPGSSLPVDYERYLEPASTLVEILKNKYLEVMLHNTKKRYVPTREISKYTPIILLCKRKGVCQEIEDIIHSFLGNLPINQWNKVSNSNLNIAKTINLDDQKTMDRLYRGWRSVNSLLCEEY